ncbi:MAG: FAD-binding oxidoreductase [Sedimentitalea sp.]
MTLAPADDIFAERLRQHLPADVLSAPHPRHMEEPRGRFQASGGLLALPRTVEQVSTLLREANIARVGVVPFGGGTGLVGGQMAPDSAPLIVSLERMTAIRAVLAQENVLVAEAGAILADVQSAAADVDRLFPLSLASEGSARIGGNLATNAGGVNVLRYGNTRDLVLGLEAVMADGQIWNGLTRLRKDNTGYDLRHLLLGSEGTLGVITAAALKLSPIPAVQGTALFVVPDPDAALALLALARGQMGEAVSAFELIHRQGFEFLTETIPELRLPFETAPEWCILMDVGLAAGLSASTALESLFETALTEGVVVDGLIAQSETQRRDFWAVREMLPEANRRIGSVSSHDISLPLGALPGFIAQMPAVIAAIGDFRINCFGHVGDGNLHYNVFAQPGRARRDHENERPAIKRAIHDQVHALGGSISAEHGIGRLKVDDLERYGDPVKLSAMRAIKTALDPHGIMNPGAVLRA